MKRDPKMIQITVSFWTNDLSEKTCWTHGYAYLKKNGTKGIKPQQVHFGNLAEIRPAIIEVLKKSDIHFTNKPEQKEQVCSSGYIK